MSFYVDPASDAAKQAIAWATSSPSQAALIRKIASQPTAKWFGDWDSDVLTDARAYVSAAASAGKVPILVAYDIPLRDCGSYSAGGATSTAAYEEWMRNLAAGIGAHEAVVILEPDALAMMDCLSSADQAARYTLINDAISTLKANPHTVVYLDAGNSNWIGAGDMAQRLIRGGIARADGFALNVSNFYWTGDNVNFGQAVSALVGGKHFIVDTSRNGDGPDGSNWCNPSGRALGQPTTANTGNPLVDGFLWTKTPGESDGTCNGGPAAGVWWPDYALGLAERAAW
ncbi:MAG: glycoside hydrolase family 6 protein [Patescibacteria group bacterium]|nr:glycoside hydrolase family 6 protein [Patescibacteria group bacterium]MDE2172471.1 glycoside hydrolase family 6 protein [Patescibacteria group bacterium]